MKGILKHMIITAIVVLLIGLLVIAGSLLRLKYQINHYASYWQSRAAQPATANSLVYVALGDSTAQGIGASQPQRGYVGLIAESLTQKTGKPVRVINISKSGAKLTDCIRDQLPQLQALEPDFLTIEIGANDMGSFEAQSFERDISALFAALPKQTVVSDMPYFGGGRRRNLEPNVIAANKIIDKVAAEHNLSVAPLHQVTKDRDNLLTNSIDLFHPSNRGYRNWAVAFEQQLSP